MSKLDYLAQNKIFELNSNKTSKRLNRSLVDIKFDFLLLNLIAFLLARGVVIDNLAPFGIAFLGSYLHKKKLSFSLTISTTIGMISIYGVNSYKHIIPIWIVYITYNSLSKKISFSVLKTSLLISGMLIIINSLIVMIDNYYLFDVIMGIFEGIIVFALTYIFSYSTSLFTGKHSRVFSNEEIISLAIIISLSISGIREMMIFSISVKEIIGTFLVLLFSFNKGVSMGTTVGITIGLVTSISSPDMTNMISVYAISGLLSGLFKELGKIGVSFGFFIGSLMMSFYINGLADPIIGIKEIAIAAIIFIVSSKYLSKSKNSIISKLLDDVESNGVYSNRIRDLIYKRLEETSTVFGELGTIFNKLVNKPKHTNVMEASNFINIIAKEVCDGCPMNRVCWENDFYSSYNSMFDLMNKLENNGNIKKEHLPPVLDKRCIRPNLLINKSNYIFDLYKVNNKWEKKVSEIRQLISYQLDGISKIVKDIANEVHDDIQFKEEIEKLIWRELKKNNIKVSEVTVVENKSKKFELYIDINKKHLNPNATDRLIEIASNVVGHKLSSERLFVSNNLREGNVKIKLIKANKYNAITKISKLESSNVSGDSYTFGERSNKYFTVLSDGMGVGKKANEESTIAVTLLEKFIEAGFDKEIALNTINSILVLKSDDEMLATVDMSIIDLYNGHSKFVKIGSAPTFIKSNNCVKSVDSNSLPIGILRTVDYSFYEEDLNNGDFVIMMSDGVLDANDKCEDKEKWMIEVLKNIDSVNPQTLADKIIDEAIKVSDYGERDDMTVLVTKIFKAI